MSFKPGDNIGPYQIVEQLGRGGMATVYKAYHPALDRYVAIKGMHVAFSQDPNFLARFQREARVVARLEHPHIVPVYDFAEHEGQPYLVMKFIEGDTLKARLGEGALTPAELTRTVEAIGGALAYAHKQGILHRDIKPSNVLLGADGGIYLTDFGLARIAQAGESTLSADMMLGTPQYISPEQALGNTNLDEGTDIYSFGIMLYELIVGQVPFSADTPYSIVHDHIYTPLPLPRLKKADIPEPLERILLKALAKRRADRFENVGQMLDAYRAAVAGQPLPPTPAAAPDPLEQLDTLAVSDSGRVSPGGATPLETRPPSGAAPSGAAPAEAQVSLQIEGDSASAPRKRRRWWLVIPAIFLLCLCLIVLRGCSQNDNSPFGPPPAGQGEPGDPGAPTALPELPATPPAVTDVDSALAAVEADPENPNAYLDLAAAYWDAGEPELAIVAFEIARELGGRDPVFLRRAANLLAARELWLETLEMIVSLALQDNGQIPREYAQLFERALYHASADPRLDDSQVITEANFQQLQGVNPLLLQVVTLRVELEDQDFEFLFSEVEALITENPEYGPAVLLKAEIYIEFGEPDVARGLLEQLVQDEPGISWVAVEARRLLLSLAQP
jgi:serine/threonine-protein kinase